MAAAIGCVQGAIQAMSRSYYGRLIPADRASEFFGFYNMMGKFAAVLGPFLMGATALLTGNSRSAILSVAMLFFGGAIMLAFATRSTARHAGRQHRNLLSSADVAASEHASGGRDARKARNACRARGPQGTGRHADLAKRCFASDCASASTIPRSSEQRRGRQGHRHRVAGVYSESHKSPRTRAAGEGFRRPGDAAVSAMARDARCDRSRTARARRSGRRSRACC